MKLLATLVITALALTLLLRPRLGARVLVRFYARYPLVRHVAADQLHVRPVFIRLAGVCLAMLAAAMLVA